MKHEQRAFEADFLPGRARPRARVWLAAWLAVVLWGLGCVPGGSVGREVSQAIGQWRRPRVDAGGRGPAVAPTSEIGVASMSGDDAGGVSAATLEPLRALTIEALTVNPSILAAVADVRAKLERIAQVTSLDDPLLKMIIRPEPIQTAAGDVVFTMGVGQKLPLPAKLDLKGRMAASEVRMAIERLNAVRLRVISDVERAYFRLYVADRSVELTAASLALLGDLERVVDLQYQVRKVEQQDLLRVQIELADMRDDERRFVRQRASAAAALNQLLDRPPSTAVPLTKPAVIRAADAEVESLIALSTRHNPDLAALMHKAQRDRDGIKLAGLGYWPDLQLGFEWSHVDGRRPFIPPINQQTGRVPPFNDASAQGDDNWAITVGVNLPIWLQRIEAAKREARHRLEATLQEHRAAKNLVAFRIFDAWERLGAQRDTAVLLDTTLIPQARQTYEVSLASYESGRIDFTDVVDNWRRLLSFELMLHRELAGMETAFSELQREVGLELVRRNVLPDADVREVQQ